MPPVCRFYLKGNCRYGQNCRFEHPGENAPSSGFSFTKALEDTPISSSPASGFSFTKALESTTPSGFGNSFIGSNQHYNQFQQPQLQHNINFSTPIFGRPPDNLSFPEFSFSNAVNQSSNFGVPQAANTGAGYFNNNNFYQSSLDQQTTLFNADDIDMRQTQEAALQQQQQQQANIQLTEPEIKAFQSDRFHYRQIPVRPPPSSLCH